MGALRFVILVMPTLSVFTSPEADDSALRRVSRLILKADVDNLGLNQPVIMSHGLFYRHKDCRQIPSKGH